jgi:beta-phosphoglucomutase
MIQGAIFDMDGVLLDNLHFHVEAFRRVGEEEGRSLRPDEVSAVFGRKTDEMFETLLGRSLSPAEADRLDRRKEAVYREMMRPHLEECVVGGLEAFLATLRERAIPVALATSGPVENVDMVLDGLRLRPHFSAVVTAAEVRRGKPDPEVFLKAAAGLGLLPERCVVFEDSPSGIVAALRAGCRCVALATTLSPVELEKLSPHRIVPDFSALTLEDL